MKIWKIKNTDGKWWTKSSTWSDKEVDAKVYVKIREAKSAIAYQTEESEYTKTKRLAAGQPKPVRILIEEEYQFIGKSEQLLGYFHDQPRGLNRAQPVCGRCNTNKAQALHRCPYKSEINGDYSECTCCEECEQNCADDI